ncbi:class I SAM-dependent methyltransferase [Oceanobacillus caeni]|uniref:class I SAM-dependent methyltransferase n=2 Tax=Bacillales TaxID=1385 RepID=UPI000760E4E1|nr:class I SAM-dependent methyltransferase [Oceanobacillus caeni]MED4475650.1 class I SAM-dependent methyltransferase [Oceanobacillus caeni]
MNNNYLDCLALFGVGGAHPGGLPLTKRILSKEEIDETKSILDAGCGTGQTSAYISKKYQCHVTSLDCNKMMLDKARKRYLSLQLPIKVDLELSADFTLSEDIDSKYFEILEKHEQLTEDYKEVLGFRIFRCCK